MNTFLPHLGESAVSMGEGVPGACLLPPSHGPGGALPVARPDDAFSLGQHHWPREADSVSAGIYHWPQVHFIFMNPVSAAQSMKSDKICCVPHINFFNHFN